LEIPPALQESGSVDLISDTAPSDTDPTDKLRNLALAYAQVGARYPEYDAKALETLELAAAAFPQDAEVQATYGKALVLTRTPNMEIAAQALQKAIDAGSKSAQVRTLLAGIRMRQKQAAAAIGLYKESIQLDPYYEPAYQELADLYEALSDSQKAVQVLGELLKVDPGNDAARMQRSKLATNASREQN